MEHQNTRFKTVMMAIERIGSMQIPIYAANACYFLALSVFPLLLIVLALVPYLPFSATDLIVLLSQVLPAALMGAAESLVVSTYYNASGAMLSVSAVAALWSASRGIYGILTGLNHIYGVREDRGYLYTRVISFVYTFVFIIVLVLTLVMQVFGPSILEWIEWGDGAVMSLISQIIDVQFVWMLIVQILVFTAFYMVLPNRHNRFWDSLPGAAVAAVGWQGFSKLFSFYVEHMGSYANIFGSVYAVALGMLWLYCCMSILLFGGGLNRMLQQWQRK